MGDTCWMVRLPGSCSILDLQATARFLGFLYAVTIPFATISRILLFGVWSPTAGPRGRIETNQSQSKGPTWSSGLVRGILSAL